ncbi:MAG: tRNA (adenosine(37)-N6)-dimethylallyltransferase MiaA [Deltaproteobacteria bacterium]|nr:tRNA (adenosine(37)-N6)-dimethylallyltransferase MiaA [Deltaproteobacteria bacterium]
MKKIVAIVGPTAVGKTEITQKLAEQFQAEIVSCDSMLFYKGFNIGTAKPKNFKVPHHMIDCIEPYENFDVMKYKEQAGTIISSLFKRDKNVFIVGGSGFYLRALMQGVYPSPPSSLHVRSELEKRDLKSLYEELQEKDPESAECLHPHDTYRIIRALEVYHLTGKKFSSFKTSFEAQKQESSYDVLCIGLVRKREELYNRIDQRVLKMIEAGFEDEVKDLLKKYSEQVLNVKAIGYKQMIQYIQGTLSFENCIKEIAKETRHYAKRQITWFRKVPGILWCHPELEQMKIQGYIRKHLNELKKYDGSVSSF